MSPEIKCGGTEVCLCVYLYGSEPCYLWRARSRGKARVKSIDVETEIHWTAAHLRPNFSHERCQRFEPTLLHLNDTETLHREHIQLFKGILPSLSLKLFLDELKESAYPFTHYVNYSLTDKCLYANVLNDNNSVDI